VSPANLHVVSGKGGTGKTTVAAAVAIALASGGRRTLLMEVEGRQGIAQLFDTPPLPYEERRVAVAPGGGEVWALAVDAEEALLDYLEIFYNLRRAGSALRKLGAIDFATTIAPGLRDVLLTGKAVEVARRSDKTDKTEKADRSVPSGANAYDAVIIDAPPTGRVTRFLNVNAEVSGLARVGPIHNHAQLVMTVINSPATRVHLVTVLEEMPVQETLDGITELQSVGLNTGMILINMVAAERLNQAQAAAIRFGSVTATDLGPALQRAGIDRDVETLGAGLLKGGRDHLRRVELQARERARLRAEHLPTIELPLLTDGVDLGGLYQLAAALTEGGLQ